MATPNTITIEQVLNSGGLAVKDNAVNLEGLNEKIVLFLAAAAQVHAALFHVPLVVTSGKDQEHISHSKHFIGRAVDLRLSDLDAVGQTICHIAFTYLACKCECGIFWEFTETPESHLHVETND